MPNLPLCIAHRADGLHFHKQLAAFAPVPDFAVPVVFFQQAFPHGLKVSLVVPTRAEQPRVAPQHLVAAVAGDAAESGIDVDNAAVWRGDHDALAGVGEHAGGQLQGLVSGFACADVRHR